MDQREIVELVHALPQRVRLRVPALVGHIDTCRRIAETLASSEGTFERVTVRPSTGSVIIEGGVEPIDGEALAARLHALIDNERDEKGNRLTDFHPDEHPGPTRVARAVTHAFFEINGDVRAALGHRADLGTILPVFFAAAGLSEVAVTGKLPVPTWFNLLWWSLRSFMTFNTSAIEAELHERRAADAY